MSVHDYRAVNANYPRNTLFSGRSWEALAHAHQMVNEFFLKVHKE